jgi:hypothetical protein
MAFEARLWDLMVAVGRWVRKHSARSATKVLLGLKYWVRSTPCKMASCHVIAYILLEPFHINAPCTVEARFRAQTLTSDYVGLSHHSSSSPVSHQSRNSLIYPMLSITQSHSLPLPLALSNDCYTPCHLRVRANSCVCYHSGI